MAQQNKPKQQDSRVTLQGVVARIKHIGAIEYDSKIYENILSIFNKLTTTEKRTLLRGLINICFIVEDRVLVEKETLTTIKDSVEKSEKKIEVMKDDIEKFNKQELIKLKTWLVKVTTIGLILIIALAFFLSIFLGSETASSFAVFQNAAEIFEVIFGDGKDK